MYEFHVSIFSLKVNILRENTDREPIYDVYELHVFLIHKGVFMCIVKNHNKLEIVGPEG